MKTVTFRTWSEIPQNTRHLKIVTKLSDMGAPMSKKSILGFYMNIRQDSAFNSINKAYHFKRVKYRTNSSSAFYNLVDFFGKPTALQPQAMYVEKILNNPITNLDNIQLQISGIVKGKFSINDFGLLYRKHREISASTQDED